MFDNLGKKLISLTTKLFTKIEYRLVNGLHELFEIIQIFMNTIQKFP